MRVTTDAAMRPHWPVLLPGYSMGDVMRFQTTVGDGRAIVWVTVDAYNDDTDQYMADDVRVESVTLEGVDIYDALTDDQLRDLEETASDMIKRGQYDN